MGTNQTCPLTFKSIFFMPTITLLLLIAICIAAFFMYDYQYLTHPFDKPARKQSITMKRSAWTLIIGTPLFILSMFI